jgi:predicted ABC-type ATPase
MIQISADIGCGGSDYPRRYRRRIPRWKELGFRVNLFFIWLPSEEMAIQRVASRVAQGGHNIAILDTRR